MAESTSSTPKGPGAPGGALAEALSARDSGEQLRLLIESVHDYAILTLDPEGHVTSWNPGAQRIKGWRADEIIGQHFSRFFTPADIAAGKPERELEIASREGRYEEEGWRLRKDGSQFWANVVITALRDPHGSLRGYGKVTRDFTERKIAQETLRQSEERFRLIVESVRDYAIFMLDAEGYVATWNPGAERFNGYRAAEIIGKHFSRFYPPEDIAAGKPAMELDVASRVGRYEEEGWRLRKDGTRFWASVVITALRDSSGKLVGFGKVTRDVTERKAADEILRQSEERFRLIVESVRDYAIFMLDPEGRVATWNPGAERFKGYKAHEIIGQHFSRFYPPEDIRSGKPAMELEVASRDGRYEEEGWRLRKDGSQFWANVVITALRDATGTLRGFAKVTRDVTERRQAQEQREVRQLRDALRSRDEFLSVASHELKTPLTPLQLRLTGLLHAIRHPTAAPVPMARITRDLELANGQVRRLSDLIEELLDVTRISAGTLRVQPAPMDLAALAREVVARYSPQVRAMGATLELLAPASVMGEWDRGRIEQVLTNLVSNAIKYGEGQPILLQVEQPQGQPEQVVVRVVDRGIGIAPEHQERIFDRFVRAVSERNFGGLGLGLFIAHQITEAHGGRIEVQSAPGEGSTFTLRLPLHTPAANAAP